MPRQNDFIDGALGTKEAQAIVPKVAAKIEAYRAAGKQIIFTRDTHEANYLETHEGKKLPVPHCIAGTAGYEISPELHVHAEDMVVNKGAFGYLHWEKLGDVGSIELCGLCTDICVVSNALILRAIYPEIDITVDASCCAGVTTESHQAALTVMGACQIEIIKNAVKTLASAASL